METVLQLNPAVKNAVEKMAPLLHQMHRAVLVETLDNADNIRGTLSEQDQATMISILISLGEL